MQIVFTLFAQYKLSIVNSSSLLWAYVVERYCKHTNYIYTVYAVCCEMYEGKSISNQPIPFPIDQDTQDVHALFQYMF